MVKIIISIAVLGSIFNLWHILIAPTEKQILNNDMPSIYGRLKSILPW